MKELAEELASDFFDAGVVKFGSFKLKSGMLSPIYLDLRLLPSHPELLKKVASLICAEIKNLGLEFDRIAGIPYAAIPIATAVCLELGKPLVYARKEVKDYGTKQPVEGAFREGETVLVIDDLITTGASKFEAFAPLEAAGLKVKDVLVVVDREQGGKEQVEEKGYRLHALVGLSELLDALRDENKIDKKTFDETLDFLKENKAK